MATETAAPVTSGPDKWTKMKEEMESHLEFMGSRESNQCFKTFGNYGPPLTYASIYKMIVSNNLSIFYDRDGVL